MLVDGKPVAGPSRKVGYMLQQDYLFEWRNDPGECRARRRDPGRRHGQGARARRRNCSPATGSANSSSTCRANCPAACASASRSPARSVPTRHRAARRAVLGARLADPFALADEVTEILRREGKTAILVTHDIGEAISMAERVVVLSRRPGRMKSDHPIRFAAADGARLAPFAARNTPEFNGYFNHAVAGARNPCRRLSRSRAASYQQWLARERRGRLAVRVRATCAARDLPRALGNLAAGAAHQSAVSPAIRRRCGRPSSTCIKPHAPHRPVS